MTALFHIDHVFDHSFTASEENLALDEVLLDAVEQGETPSALRFWESPNLFVVLGVAQAARNEVNGEACAADRVPVRRRCSGGGCVVQGPGSLNFTLALALESNPGARGLRESYAAILGALAAAFIQRDVPARHEGVCDLAVAGLKVSGNAQKRRRRAILHHGTLLYGMGPGAMMRYLREPTDRPVYRGERDHAAFVGELGFPPEILKSVVREAFDIASTPLSTLPESTLAATRALAAEKYVDPAWIYRR